MNKLVNEKILALHYVYPLTLNRLKKLEQVIGSMINFEEISPQIIAQIFNINVQNATVLKNQYMRIIHTPLLESFESENIVPILYNDPRYPSSLHQLIDPPTILYAKGDTSILQSQKIAIIGSRNATNYSVIAMDLIIPPLVEHRITIVSGFAKGADSLAHHATIRYGGRTIGILGHGFFHCYPRSNRALFEEMTQNQLLLTEYPPYVKPQKWHFPMRNRIISGISDALVVTEAGLRSGTLITTDHALEHGKEIFVVPGPIHSEQSKGTNKLIKDGAIVAYNGYEIINEMQTFS